VHNALRRGQVVVVTGRDDGILDVFDERSQFVSTGRKLAPRGGNGCQAFAEKRATNSSRCHDALQTKYWSCWGKPS